VHQLNSLKKEEYEKKKKPPELNLEFLSQASALKSTFVFSKSPPLWTIPMDPATASLWSTHSCIFRKTARCPNLLDRVSPCFPRLMFFHWKTLIVLFSCHYFQEPLGLNVILFIVRLHSSRRKIWA